MNEGVPMDPKDLPLLARLKQEHESADRELKQRINEVLFAELPETVTLGKMEDIAVELYRTISGEWDMAIDKATREAPAKPLPKDPASEAGRTRHA